MWCVWCEREREREIDFHCPDIVGGRYIDMNVIGCTQTLYIWHALLFGDCLLVLVFLKGGYKAFLDLSIKAFLFFYPSHGTVTVRLRYGHGKLFTDLGSRPIIEFVCPLLAVRMAI